MRRKNTKFYQRMLLHSCDRLRPITLESIWGISLFARIAPRTTSFTLQRQLHVNLLLHVDYYNIYLMRMPEIKTFLQLHNNSNHVFLNTRKDFNRKYIRILSFFTPFYFKNQENGVLCCIYYVYCMKCKAFALTRS